MPESLPSGVDDDNEFASVFSRFQKRGAQAETATTVTTSYVRSLDEFLFARRFFAIVNVLGSFLTLKTSASAQRWRSENHNRIAGRKYGVDEQRRAEADEKGTQSSEARRRRRFEANRQEARDC